MNGDDQERHYDGPREYQDFQHVQGEIEHKGRTDPNAYERPNDCDPLGESYGLFAHMLEQELLGHGRTPEELQTAFEDEARKRFS